jgi:hypothetical protein
MLSDYTTIFLFWEIDYGKRDVKLRQGFDTTGYLWYKT